ncbi:shikimate dehydrogenase [Corynebacterium diphtheriae]|uniref:shikimate dehydrogenase (NADP(+)) n=2 Tax=Corynebacterium diphtheriae TaxID=1717 RepID=A0A811G232_CORDP|nr:Shikimate dehydrogenase [Corynebacterium diphtheriae]SUY75024.1 shikimate 5-dehydrogenase [Corynebacterium diphtheriae bv. mitis]CAB0553479.1 shikimate dehydrogenase [Corynebacterium diphtheriae]CAB0554319.1 shikimate dehydrogenase [Corynebacterium diphtheriae]CAB0555528.1 shikimate dehydrogenase [Corynebacterium diphtheriae]
MPGHFILTIMIHFRAAVLGHPIEHSLSPLLHNAGYAAIGLSQWSYGRFDCDSQQLSELVDKCDPSFQGFSVTMPCKFEALEYATSVSERAQRIGSANTLVRAENGWYADNTDTEGVRGALEILFSDRGGSAEALKNTRAIVVGAGGTSRPAIWTLGTLGVAEIVVVNRSDRREELEPVLEGEPTKISFVGFDSNIRSYAQSASVVISTVPSVGVSDYIDDLVHAPVLDVIYDPWPTPLIQHAQKKGVPCIGGHIMLLHQALSQFEQFTGVKAPREAMQKALFDHLFGDN